MKHQNETKGHRVPRAPRALLAAVLLAAVAVPATVAPAEVSRIFWTEIPGGVRAASPDGSDLEVFYGPNAATDVALDTAGGKVYWIDADSRLWRTDLDDPFPPELLIGTIVADGIALDLDNGKIYLAVVDTIKRANLDGSDLETVVSGLVRAHGIALDVDGGKLYWSDNHGFAIQRANLDGSEVETLVSGFSVAGTPEDIALDLVNGRVYWINASTAPKISRAAFDGTAVEHLVVGASSGEFYPRDIALDVADGMMYWNDGVTDAVYRADLAGGDIEIMFAVPSGPLGLALDHTPAPAGSAADVSGDGVVSVADVVAVILAFGTCPSDPDPCAADVTGDGIVDVADLVEVILGWGCAM